MVAHHPLLTLGATYWALLSIAVKLDTSALIVGVLPTVAVVVQYFLAKHRANEIAADAAAKVAQVHTIVNGQRTETGSKIAALEAELAQANARIGELTDRVATMVPPTPAPAT